MTSLTLTDLRCEYAAHPLGLGVAQPRLSWKLQSGQRGARQTAYQILATDNPGDLSSGKGTLWDSGKVTSDQSVNVLYGGAPLQSRQRVWWKVRIWDESDQVSEDSVTSWWEMGLLDQSEWIGQWIGSAPAGGPETGAPCPFLRQVFALAKPIQSARLYATSLGVYEFHCNGQKVGTDVLTPGWTDYKKQVQYQVYDVSSLLQQGENVVGAILGDGWYCGHIGWVSRQFYGEFPALLAQIHVTFEDGSETVIATDPTWKTASGPLLESDLLMGESYDARREMPGWDTSSFDESGWLPVTISDAPKITLSAMRGPTVQAIEEIIPPHDPQGNVVDLGQNMVGWVRLKVKGPAGATVRLRFAETLQGGPAATTGGIYTTNLRQAKQTDYYTLKGDPEGEVYEPRFTFHGFRYVEVSGLPEPLTRETITGVVIHSETPATGTFECSDPLLNQLQKNIDWGQRGNFVDIPTDCPQRDERLGWTGDAQVFIRTAAFNRDVAGFFTKWMQDLEDAQGAKGEYPSTAPHIGAVDSDGGPAWADAGIICPWTMYLCYGDTRLLETHYASMTRFLDYLQESSQNLIRCYDDYPAFKGFGDWLALDGSGKTDGGSPRDLLGTAFFAHDAQLMARIATILGKEGDAVRYAALAGQVKDAFQKRFITAEGLVIGGTQTGYVLALHFDLMPEDLRLAAADALVRDIKSRGMHLSTGFVATSYLPFVLAETGHLDIAYALLHQKSWPSWLYAVTQGATTIWERWDGWTQERGFQDVGMNSFNHYAYGAIGSWLYETVAGIEIDSQKPGYKHILLHPHPGGGLTSVQAFLESLYGKIGSAWTQENGEFVWEVTVPPNTTATAYVPTGAPGTVQEGDVPAEQAEGVSFLRHEDGASVYALPSGHYRFTVKSA